MTIDKSGWETRPVVPLRALSKETLSAGGDCRAMCVLSLNRFHLLKSGSPRALQIRIHLVEARAFGMRKYINDAHLAKKMGKTRSERLSVFFDLVKLRLKRRFAGMRKEECKVRVLGYEVSGFSYFALERLMLKALN